MYLLEFEHVTKRSGRDVVVDDLTFAVLPAPEPTRVASRGFWTKSAWVT